MESENLDQDNSCGRINLHDESINSLDKLIEIENLNAAELLTSSEVLENIQLYDSTV